MGQPNNRQEQPRAGQGVSDDTILKIAKEIAVKFIEVGRLTPSTFDETFKAIYRTVDEAVPRHE
ncbi:hypothetical protein [Desulfofustis limnaeus]|jgi:hypothetical protein|uniref:Conjugal transfer protein TraB n=1 Tax=Desulfofustis limnaeus TaxID=2740163 RepID=A0ABM7W7D7_9BACT|nr:hypothetical protein [Desulfofustis limnaeus]MDX9896268.1 hypothetical protein [Desulfofustis sp.]BDD86849.1 hypothetical protein DPPLL_12140 [Desulfofustis limnaeus]